jgi:hypothetical protein
MQTPPIGVLYGFLRNMYRFFGKVSILTLEPDQGYPASKDGDPRMRKRRKKSAFLT